MMKVMNSLEYKGGEVEFVDRDRLVSLLSKKGIGDAETKKMLNK